MPARVAVEPRGSGELQPAALIQPEAALIQPEAALIQPEAALIRPEAAPVRPEAALVRPEAAAWAQRVVRKLGWTRRGTGPPEKSFESA